MIANDVKAPKTHELPLLCDLCIEINENFQKMYSVCEFLTQYGVQPRYPNEIEVLEIDSERALKNVQEMLVFFESQGIEIKP